MSNTRFIKRIQLILTILVLCFAISFIASQNAYAAEEIASGTCGDNLTWVLNDDGNLKISGSGDMTDWKQATASWNDYTNDIKKVTIGSEVTSIGNYAFYECSNLTSIDIPDSVTSIGNGAFWNCNSLMGIDIPNSVTSIGIIVFKNCSNLTSIDIPDSVTSIGNGAFEDCSNLTSIDIPDSVTSIGIKMFMNCSNLTSIDIPDSVTSFEDYAFYGCSSLTNIIIPDEMTRIKQYTFYNCSSLTSIDIPLGVRSIEYCSFRGCSSLTSITIPISVESIELYAFEGLPSTICIFYGGSENEWSKLGNYKPRGKVHYNSTGHTWSEDFIVDSEPTCTREGSKSKHCIYCNEKSEVTVIDAGHDWNEGVITTEPKCTEAGVKTFTCKRCKETKTEGIPSLGYEGHDWSKWEFDKKTKTHSRACSRCKEKETQQCIFDEGVISREPTASEGGEKIYTCNVCKGTYTEEIPQLGYKLQVIDNNNNLERRYLKGEKVTVSAANETEYRKFTKWEVTTGNLTLSSTEETANSLKFTMPASDVTITAIYEGDSLQNELEAENNRHNAVQLRASILKANINTYSETANRIKNKYGVGYLQSSTYYNNKAASVQTELTKKQNRLAILKADTAGGNQLEIKQLESEIQELQSDYQMYLELKSAAQYQEKANAAQYELDRIDLDQEEQTHKNNVERICKNHGVKNANVKEVEYIMLDAKEYYYTGKPIHPNITVIDSSGQTVDSRSYDVVYPNNCTTPGDHIVTIKFKGNYVGSKTKTFTIINLGGWKKIDGEWYYFKSDGEKATNAWAKDSKGWCWMDGNGRITKSKWIKSGGEWYYLKSNGYMAASEWAKDSGGWYWMNGSGKIAKNVWAKDSGGWYWMNGSGRIAKNAWAKDSKGWCWMGSNGRMVKSKWVKSRNNWYYLNASGYMVTGTQKIGGKTYRFDKSGKWIS